MRGLSSVQRDVIVERILRSDPDLAHVLPAMRAGVIYGARTVRKVARRMCARITTNRESVVAGQSSGQSTCGWS